MAFITDKQTLEDLNLTARYRTDSIFSLFNKVRTSGAQRMLEEMFHHPLTDHDDINARSGIFSYFQQIKLPFPFDEARLGTAIQYLEERSAGNLAAVVAGVAKKKILQLFIRDERYRAIHDGLLAAVSTIAALQRFLQALDTNAEHPYSLRLSELKKSLSNKRLQWIFTVDSTAFLSPWRLARYDHLLKHVLADDMERLLLGIYELDLYIAVSGVARQRNFSYARALPKHTNHLEASALYHPALHNGVANPCSLSGNTNMMFLTGANMAGKSTLMKAIGISVYLAHMGFPVAAREMSFSIRDGIYSSINVPDNLSLGYSHFYAEVLRVKEIAREVSSGKDMLVIFDELFKGTNVKDAFDATLVVTELLSKYRNCLFIVSTHIIEVGDDLRKRSTNMQFSYLPTQMRGTVPEYTYRLQPGITSDRHGMMIIENEGILEMLTKKRN